MPNLEDDYFYPCPDCVELVDSDITVCRSCGVDITKKVPLARPTLQITLEHLRKTLELSPEQIKNIEIAWGTMRLRKHRNNY